MAIASAGHVSTSQANADRGSRPLHELDLRDELDLVSFVSNLWQTGKSDKLDVENRWAQHLAHFQGDQWLYYDKLNNEFIFASSDQEPPHRTRMCINLLQGYVESRVARLTQGRITWNCIPSTDDQQDRDRSRHQERVLKFLWNDLNMSAKWIEANFWLALCHNVFLFSGWDPDAGSGVPIERQELRGLVEGMEQLDQPDDQLERIFQAEYGLGVENGLTAYRGNNVAEVVPPFEVIPDPHARNFADCQYALRSRRRTKSYLLERYPKHRKRIETLGGTRGGESGYDVYPGDPYLCLEPLGDSEGKATDRLEDTFIVHELWFKSCDRYPRGLHGVVAGDLVLLLADNPYDELPFVHLQELPCPGRFWGTGAFTQADEVQLGLNSLVSQKVEIMKATCHPSVFSEKGVGLDLNTYVPESGTVWEVNRISGVHQYVPPPVPAYVENLLQFYLDALQRIFGDFDVSLGRSTSEATSGRAIGLLQEANDRRTGPILDRLEQGLAAFGECQLRIAADNWEEPRTIHVIGEQGQREYLTVRGSDVAAGEAGLLRYDVQVSIARRRSTSVVLNELDFLLSRGVLDPVRHRQQILDAMQFEGTELGGWDLTAADRSKAGQENQAIIEAGVPAVLSYGDDDAAHLEVHLAGMKTVPMDRLAQQNPQVVPLFQQHIAEHLRQQAVKVAQPAVIQRQVVMQMMAEAGVLPQPVQPGLEPSQAPPATPDNGRNGNAGNQRGFF